MTRRAARRLAWALPPIAAVVLVATVVTGSPDPPTRPPSTTAPAPGSVDLPPPGRAFPRAPALDEADALRGGLISDADPPRPRSGALRATVRGGDGNAYGRGRIDVAWDEGDDVRYGADYLLPDGFAAALDGQVDLLRWDDFPTQPRQTHRSGVVVFAGDRRGHLIRQRLGVEETSIAPAFDLPEGRWFHLEVRQRLGRAGTARNEVRVDGRVVASSSVANTYGNTVERVRFGLVAIDADRQRRDVTLWLARPWALPLP